MEPDDRAHAGKLVRVAAVVTEIVMPFRHADFAIGPVAAFAPDDKRDRAGQIGLEGQCLQVKHELNVIAPLVGNAGRTVGRWQFGQPLVGCNLDAAFDIA